MGVYDTVQFGCLECGDLVEAQSKADRCEMRIFDHRDKNIPQRILNDLDGDKDVSCYKCRTLFDIKRVKDELIIFNKRPVVKNYWSNKFANT